MIPRPSCHKNVEPDSAFCRHCGTRLGEASAPERADVLERMGTLFPDGGIAMDGALEYFSRWPDGPEARDAAGNVEADFEDASRLASDVDRGVPLNPAILTTRR